MNTSVNNSKKTFAVSDAVRVEKVSFRNRYGITLSADLYLPEERAGELLSAIAICGPFGAVKEQASGLYANTLAARGFATLAFDPSFTGESGGEPRNNASPEINTEDFSAAVDYLGIQPFINRNRIGIIGICGYGGMALNAAAIDTRIKVVATTSMSDMSRVLAKGFMDTLTPAQRRQQLEQLNEQRWADASAGTTATGALMVPEQIDANTDANTAEYFDYYRTKRGFHERSVNSTGAFTATMPLSFMNMPMLTYISQISPRQVLIVAGENAYTKYMSEDAYSAATAPKELLMVPGASHVDLYDQIDKIPFDKLVAFFGEYMQ